MGFFHSDLKVGEKKEFQTCEFLNYINYNGCKYYRVKSLDEYVISEDVRQKIAEYQIELINAQIQSNCKKEQIDAFQVSPIGEIEKVEIKWDNSDILSYNLFIEFKDVDLRDESIVNITGPWRSVLKKEKLWAHNRDRKFRHNEDAILYMFDPKKLADFVDANKKNYQKRTIKNTIGDREWVTYGWLVPETDIKDICECEIKISDEDYKRFFLA